jgi:hypothetical protein
MRNCKTEGGKIMRKYLLRKMLIIGIIFLFVGSTTHLAAFSIKIDNISNYSDNNNPKLLHGKKEFFGASVSMDENCIIIGAPFRGTDKGSAYIYNHDGTSWKMKQKLIGSHDDFGHSVSISGDYAIVGAPRRKAYIFKNDGINWIEDAVLTPSDSSHSDVFGESVSISGNYAIVGNPRAHNDNHGSAYIFKREDKGWSEVCILNVNEGGDDQFGNSVSIDGDYAVVGAYYENKERGAAYIFKRDDTGWSQQAKLVAPDGEDDDKFGKSVSINDNYVIIGAYTDDEISYNSGSAYVFRRDGTSWDMEKKLIPINDFGAFYGWSVSIDGEYAIAASYLEKKAYIFKRDDTEWSQQATLVASNVDKQTYFGMSVFIKGDYAVVGAYNLLENWILRDEVYVYKHIGNNWICEKILHPPSKNRCISIQCSGLLLRFIDMFPILRHLLRL